MNIYDLTGRTALVTGGASGIGRATAERLRAGGAEVAVFDREPVEGYVSITGDIASSADAGAAVAKADKELGRIDILVNSAGIPGESTSPTRSGGASSRSTRTARSICAGLCSRG